VSLTTSPDPFPRQVFLTILLLSLCINIKMINYIIVTHYQIQIAGFSISKRYL
jgi:hypothetical protein